MDDLLRWLGAILDAEEEQARAATPGPWWHNPGKQWLGPDAFEKYDLRQGEEFVGYGGPHPFTGAVASTGPASNMQGMKDAAFIAAHDPARVLQETEAKRGIVARYEFACGEAAVLGISEEERETRVQVAGALQSCVLCFAAIYADRPGYREEWRP
ncbi:DUF6221 family protein [Streptomyces sp. NPDC001315]|uniref:DUF6221 family protein n=1 Tax=Streptomyces sp. NPDC001315 TaxID=3364562 RepID=UPI0036B9BFA5